MPATLQHTTITIQAGILGDSADTHLYEYAPNDRDAWWISTFRVGYSHPYERGRYHGLLRFDLSPIPPGATVTHAQLELYSDGWSDDGSAIIVGAYAVLRDTVIHEATWSEFQVGQPWRQPGCDYVGTDRLGEAAGTTQFEGIQRWYQLELTQAVRSWVSGDLDNNGALLRVESGNGFFAISSRDGYDVSRRPKLVVTYAVGHTPTATTTSPTPSPSPTTAETTTTLQNGLGSYSGSTDTYLYEFAPVQNYCDQNLLAVGHGQRYASWLRFDLSSLRT